MKETGILKNVLILLILLSAIKPLAAQNLSDSRNLLFDEEWSFKKTNVASGPEQSGFDDSDWRVLDLPHDWSIEPLPEQIADSIIGPFSKAAVGKRHTGYTVGGTAWYRKNFTLNKEDKGKTIYINFDGVYRNSDVWINGHHLGNHPHGYTPFYYNLTPFLNPAGEENTIAVQVKNEGDNSRWYSGSGIYRHVWLTNVNPVHVAIWGVSVSTPQVSKQSADVQLVATINNNGEKDEEVKVLIQLIDKDGQLSATSENTISVEAGSNAELTQLIPVTNPKLWSPQTPDLYKVKISVLRKNKEADVVTETFGIREIKITAQEGLLLNGEAVLLNGACIHHDNGFLGAVAIDRAEERKIELLKANGYNAIRLSHNPYSTYFYDVCDRLGMLVIDEAFDMWSTEKTPDDYHLFFNDNWEKDLEAMILRDRNHPSVILWSIGNEIPERVDSLGFVTREKLVAKVKELDPTRMLTEALQYGANWQTGAPKAFSQMDIAGYNYGYFLYANALKNYPERIIVGTETFVNKVYEDWKLITENTNIIGGFVWTAMDYLGEAALGGSSLRGETTKENKWPWFNAFSGDIDITGDKKPQKAHRDVAWDISKIEINVHTPVPEGKSEVLTLWGWPDEWSHWTWLGHEGKPIQVRVFTKAPKVRLELNGELVGEKELTEKDKFMAVFEVSYQPGELKAIAIEDGKEIASKILKTTGEPYSIRLTADRTTIKADRNDLSFVKIEVVDKDGNLVPTDSVKLTISVSGEGELAASGNANPTDMKSVNSEIVTTFKGKAQAIVRPFTTGGEIKLKVENIDLKGAEINITTH